MQEKQQEYKGETMDKCNWELIKNVRKKSRKKLGKNICWKKNEPMKNVRKKLGKLYAGPYGKHRHDLGMKYTKEQEGTREKGIEKVARHDAKYVRNVARK